MAKTLETIFDWAASTGEQWMVDFNMRKAHWPISTALASGRLLDADDVAGVSSMGQIGTTRRPNGERLQNVIDYTLTTRDIVVVSRTQVKGVADHDLISYQIVVDDDVAGVKWPRRAKLQPVPVSQARLHIGSQTKMFLKLALSDVTRPALGKS